jgi:hypothetical protein
VPALCGSFLFDPERFIILAVLALPARTMPREECGSILFRVYPFVRRPAQLVAQVVWRALAPRVIWGFGPNSEVRRNGAV